MHNLSIDMQCYTIQLETIEDASSDMHASCRMHASPISFHRLLHDAEICIYLKHDIGTMLMPHSHMQLRTGACSNDV
jgi:hypothetical protein